MNSYGCPQLMRVLSVRSAHQQTAGHVRYSPETR